MSLLRFALFVVLSSILGSHLFAQESDEQPMLEEKPTAAELALQIRQAVEQLQAKREQRQRVEQLHRDSVERVQRQIESLRADLAVVEPVVEEQQDRVEQLEAQIAEQQLHQTNAKMLIDLAVQQIKPAAQAVFERTQLQSGGRLSQRLLRFKDAANTLKKDDTQQQLEALSAFCTGLGEEWPRAGAVSLGNEPIIVGEQEHHAWLIEFGFAAKLFVSEDRRLVGIFSPNAEQLWMLDASEEAQQYAQQILRVVQEESPPTLTPLPVLIGQAK